MATHLTAADLAAFLRSRKSADCRIAADWVDEWPTAEKTKKAVEQLEKYVLALGDSTEIRHVCIAAGLHNQANWGAVRRSMALGAAISERFLPRSGLQSGWWEDVLIAARGHFRRRSPSWAAHILRTIRGTSPKKESQRDKRFTVEFLILKRVSVSELDSLQAERVAAQRLTEKQREAVWKMRVFDQDNNPTADVQVGPDGGFWTPEKTWWE